MAVVKPAAKMTRCPKCGSMHPASAACGGKKKK